MEPFVEKEFSDGLKLLYIGDWMLRNPSLSVGFSTRVGGVSTGEWDALNCAFHVDDLPQDVIVNRRMLTKSIGFPFEAWTCAEQVHDNRVYHVKAEDKGKGQLSRESAIQNADALITDEPDILLTSFYADCVPLFFWDEETDAVGLAHAGWRGTSKTIAAETVQQMAKLFHCSLDSLKVVIGPAIGPCCYEVDDAVAHHFQTADLRTGVQAKSNGKYWLDLKQLNRQIMIKAGILPSHIEMSHYCTSCHPELFYSHRRDQGRTGRMISWIGKGMG